MAIFESDRGDERTGVRNEGQRREKGQWLVVSG